MWLIRLLRNMQDPGEKGDNMNELLQLFLVFAQLGAVTFGGGYAMLPLLTREFVDKRGWLTDSELTDYFAIG